MIIVLDYDNNSDRYLITLKVNEYTASLAYDYADMHKIPALLHVLKQTNDLNIIFTYEMSTLQQLLSTEGII